MDFLTFLTTLRAFSDIFYSVFLDFSLLYYLSGFKRPFIDRFFWFLPFLHQKYKYYPIKGLKKPDVWLKEPKFGRNGQKKALYCPIGSKGAKNREKRNKIGRKKPEMWLKRSKIHQKWVKKALNGHMCGEKGYQSM